METTKFILITTKHTQKELEEKLLSQDPVYIKYITELYSSFRYFEDDSELETKMYAIIDEHLLSKLAKVFLDLEVIWTFEDITKQILRCDRDEIVESGSFGEIVNKMMYDYITDFTTVDVILDKIGESTPDLKGKVGSERLTDFDKSILNALSAK